MGHSAAIRCSARRSWRTKPQTAGARAITGRPVAKLPDRRTTGTAIAAMLPPGVLCGHTINVERTPARRPNAAALSLVGVMNSFPFDWLLRQKAAAHVSLYILLELPVPQLDRDADRLLAHAALRLCCNHRGFASLWREQLGVAWEEASPRRSWPGDALPKPIAGDCGRQWMPSSPMHTGSIARSMSAFLPVSVTNPFPRRLCFVLPRSMRLGRVGLTQFCRDRDPYCDIPLVTKPAKPVIHLPDASTGQRSLLPRAIG